MLKQILKFKKSIIYLSFFLIFLFIVSFFFQPISVVGLEGDNRFSFNSNQTPKTNESKANFLLGLGSIGKTVIELQTQLKALGYFQGDIDGVYGGSTRLSVLEFQLKEGLEVDGLVGSKTWQQLQQSKLNSETVLSPELTADAENEDALNLDSDRYTMSPDLARIFDRGKLVVAVLGRDNIPFFQSTQENALDGLDIQLAKDIAEHLGLEIEFNRSAQTFDQIVDAVFNHQADFAASKVSRTLKRAIKVRFSSPYLDMRQALLVNRLQLAQQMKGKQMIEFIRNLTGKVGVIQESSYVGFIKEKFPQATVVEYPSWDEVVQAVLDGEILAAYRDELEIKKVILRRPDAALKLETIALTDTRDPIAMVFPWDQLQLLNFVNQYLEEKQISYTADTLLEEYADMIKNET